jgi:hypothetical protein
MDQHLVMDTQAQAWLDSHIAQHPAPATWRVSASCPMCLRIIVDGTLVLDGGGKAHSLRDDREARARVAAR